jgi:phosphoribosylformylglycinamidine synthase subunit PurS
MKVSVLVRLKKEVLDPQGDAVRRALGSMNFEGIKGVRVGKLIEIELEDGTSDAEVRGRIQKMGEGLLANPVIEDIEIVDR